MLRSKLITLSRQYFCRNFTVGYHTGSQPGVLVPQLGTSFPYRWLRDSCQCSDCVHPSTLQKLHRTSDFPENNTPGEVELTENELRVNWQGESCHKSVYPLGWLERYASAEQRRSFHKDRSRLTWTAAQLSKAPHLFVDYAKLRDGDDPRPLLDAFTQLTEFGILFVRGVSNTVTNDENCELRRLASIFGRIRDTFYGEVWNVKNIVNSTNIAYTNLDLGLHMDLLYFQHPPRYQILHCLRNRVHGGTSIFLDAVYAAERLHSQSPHAFDTLTRTPVSYHYINDGHHLHHSHPVISLSPVCDGPSHTAITHVNYSPPFQAPLPIDTPDEFYSALKEFVGLLDEERHRFKYTLHEGDAVLFDNRRVLHARTEFRERESHKLEEETSRWLKGCYLEADDILDRFRRLLKTNAK